MRGEGLVAGIDDNETAGAIGALRGTLGKTGLAKQGRLLVPGNTADRYTTGGQMIGGLQEMRTRPTPTAS